MPPPPGGNGSGDSARTARPAFLQPPATIISPPSPTDLKTSHSEVFSSSPQSESASPVQYDSPEEDEEVELPLPRPGSSRRRNAPRRPRGPSDSLGPAPIAADQLSKSPSHSHDLLHPDSPSGSVHLTSPSKLPSTFNTHRSPSASRSRSQTRTPSSPGPGYFGHRRMSSTHRVRETTDGETRSTEDGERMVNQYKIGNSLGQGAYAKVELGVDVGTGIEYAVKEFSKSRLHHQALQQKHQQSIRSRNRRSRPVPRGSPNPPDEVGKRKAGEEVGSQADGSEVSLNDDGGPWKDDGDDPLGLIRREIAVMKKLDHPNIVHLYEAISVPSADSLFLILEYMQGGVLMSVKAGKEEGKEAEPFEMEQAREYFRQLCLGLEYLHANEIVHRDIKPDNILLSADRSVVKLCDFGVSEMFIASGDDRIKKSGGSPAFLSPESFTSHTGDVHGKAVDVWALGVTLYCMLTGRLPFNVDNPIELFDVVVKQDPPLPEEWDDNLNDLIIRMLDKNPDTRIAMSEIRDHPWVTANDEEPMISVDENLYELGKQVEEPTVEELGNAIGSLRGVFTVIRAVQKMRRLQLHRRSLSSQTQPSSPGSGPQSLASGSMDSYTSNPTSQEDDDHPKYGRYGDIAGEEVGTPGSYRSETGDGGTEKEWGNPFDRLKPIVTDVKASEAEEEKTARPREVKAVLVDSPSGGGEDTPGASSPKGLGLR